MADGIPLYEPKQTDINDPISLSTETTPTMRLSSDLKAHHEWFMLHSQKTARIRNLTYGPTTSP